MHSQVTALSPRQFFQQSIDRMFQLVDGRTRIPATDRSNVQRGLEALPLAQGEFAVCVSNLKSAVDYASQAKWGAAHYELNLLLRRVLRTLDLPTRTPRRRKRSSTAPLPASDSGDASGDRWLGQQRGERPVIAVSVDEAAVAP